MKKTFGWVLGTLFVSVVAITPGHAYAQDATYSCGAYGVGDYSTNNCTQDNGGDVDGGGNTDNGTNASEPSGSGGGSVENNGTEGGDKNENSNNGDREVGGGIFSVIFAKLMTSWGWVLTFVLLIVVGVVLIGLARRKKSDE